MYAFTYILECVFLRKILLRSNRSLVKIYVNAYIYIYFKRAVNNGYGWNSKLCYNAAKYGNIDLLKWLRSNNCPWDNNTCSAAAYAGHFEILKWAREKG